MKPYPHQADSISEIIKHFNTQDRLLFSLATGGG
jgi:superfamily II DNA or RNA helicase